MKKINKAFLALAAALVFGTFASAQDNPYLMDFGKGIGYNKTVLMNHETGQRTIRLETFAMGGGERKAIPSDIVLVLDNSGSMQYHYVVSVADQQLYKSVLTQEEVDAGTSMGDPLLVPENDNYIVAYGYTYGGYPRASDNRYNALSSVYTAFNNEGATTGSGSTLRPLLANCFRYAKYNGKYYMIFHRQETHSGSTYSYLCFRLEDNTLMYLCGDSFYTWDNLPDPYAFRFQGTNKIIYQSTSDDTKLYRAVNRIDKLLAGVNDFIDEIAANNERIADDLGDKVGNQIGIVAFGSPTIEAYGSAWPAQPNPYLHETTDKTRILQTLTPVRDAGGSRVAEIKGALNHIQFAGGTSIGYGMMLAAETFNKLRYGSFTGVPTAEDYTMDAYEMNSAGQYINQDGEPLSGSDQPVVNRSKIVVMFTDGEPTEEAPFVESSPYTLQSGTSTRRWNRVRALWFSEFIKRTAPGDINGKVFTIGLKPVAGDEAFMKHLSSDYSGSSLKTDVYPPTDGSTATPPASAYNGNRTTTGSYKYYMDAGVTDLSDIFQSIASSAGGSSSFGSSSLLNIDIVSKSFKIEGGAVPESITLSVAQCLGLDPDHTYTRNGATKHYLAFSEPIPIANCTNVRLWVDTTDETSGTTTWAPENLNLAEGVSVSVTDGGKVTVSGFDYAKLWCGFDDPAHDNSRLYTPSDYGDYYQEIVGPKGSYFVDGYRGFKLIIDIPITPQDHAIGGSHVLTNAPGSGLYDPSDLSEPQISYPTPETIVSPVNLWVQKEGLKKGESASFTILRKSALDPSDTYKPYTNMIITGETDTDGSSKPVLVKLLNLDASYYYMIQEDGWSWTYTKAPAAPTTETLIENPIVITNTPKPGTLPKHAESIAKNQMGTAAGVGGSTTTISTREHTTVTP